MSDDSSPDKTEIEDEAIDDESLRKEKSVTEKQTNISEKQSRFANLEDISFQFVAYDSDITILGSKGSGKSYLANSIMKSLNGISVWVYDFNFQFHSSRAIVFNDLSKMLEVYDSAKRGHYILQPHDNSENTFRRFCEHG